MTPGIQHRTLRAYDDIYEGALLDWLRRARPTFSNRQIVKLLRSEWQIHTSYESVRRWYQAIAEHDQYDALIDPTESDPA